MQIAAANLSHESNDVEPKIVMPCVFNVGFVVEREASLDVKRAVFKSSFQPRTALKRIDWFSWARTWKSRRAIALAHRYFGISFLVSSMRARLYIIYVSEAELADVGVRVSTFDDRWRLDNQTSALLERLKGSTNSSS